LRNIQKKAFFIILAIFVLATICQLYDYFYPMDVHVIIMDESWAQITITLVLATLFLVAINIVTFKAATSNSNINEIDSWIMASSVLILAFYLLTRIVIPYAFFYSIGRLDLLF